MITCPRCNEKTLRWNALHRCCQDCVSMDDLDRFVERTTEALKLPPVKYKVYNFETGEWDERQARP